MDEIKCLVICSTLNQINNYLIIKKYKPEIIYNITCNMDCSDKNIYLDLEASGENKKWDTYLKNEINKIEVGNDFYKPKIINIVLTLQEITFIDKMYNCISNKFKSVNEDIVWHITGGQRTVTLAIQKYIASKDRTHLNDVLLYIEGNTEKLIAFDKSLKVVNKVIFDDDYGDNELKLDTVFNLAGFKNCNLKKLDDSVIDSTNKAYSELYNLIIEEKENTETSFINTLLESNKFDEKENGKKRLELIVKKLKCYNKSEYSEIIETINEVKAAYPAGSILENIVESQFYKFMIDTKIICDISSNYKVKFNDANKLEKDKSSRKTAGIIDELDIVVLKRTGKVIVFECKSGLMSGDNAKSHKYTTYRLAGVFGIPILITLFTRKEIDNYNGEETKQLSENQYRALTSANTAELEKCGIDEINKKLSEICEGNNNV